MQTFLNAKLDHELAQALTEYGNESNQSKNAIVSIGLLQIIPKAILKKYNVEEVLKNKGIIASIENLGLVGFKNKHAGRIYKLLHEHLSEEVFRISVDDFHKYMEFKENEYQTFGLIKLRVIDPAIKELNKKTSFIISYEAEKTGRSITSLLFSIKKV